MKLFTIESNEGKSTGLFFDNKIEAKARRNHLNGGTPAELKAAEKPVKFKIVRGPDHRLA